MSQAFAGLEDTENESAFTNSNMIHDSLESYECKYLNDAELLAFLSGIKLGRAKEILQQYRLHEIEDYLEGMTPKITELQKKTILSVFEFSRRIFRQPIEKQQYVKSPPEVVSLLEGDMRYLKKEIFVCIHLNTKNVILRKETISVGSLNASIVHPREVFSNAVKHSASGVIFCHNTPVETARPVVKISRLQNGWWMPAMFSVSRCWITLLLGMENISV